MNRSKKDALAKLEQLAKEHDVVKPEAPEGLTYSQADTWRRNDVEYKAWRTQQIELDNAIRRLNLDLARSVTKADMSLAIADEAGKWASGPAYRQAKLFTTFDLTEGALRTLGINTRNRHDVQNAVKGALKDLVANGVLQAVRAGDAGRARPHGTTDATWLYGTPEHVASIHQVQADRKQAEAEAAVRAANARDLADRLLGIHVEANGHQVTVDHADFIQILTMIGKAGA